MSHYTLERNFDGLDPVEIVLLLDGEKLATFYDRATAELTANFLNHLRNPSSRIQAG